MIGLTRTLLATAALALAAPCVAQGGSGALDRSYGVDGRGLALHPRAVPFLNERIASRTAVDAEGRVLFGGDARPLDGGDGRVATVVRFDADGDLDTSFGSGGFAELPMPVVDGLADVSGLVVDAGGGIVVLFRYYGANVGNLIRSRLCRLLPSGQLDEMFGEDGCRLVQFDLQGVQEATRDLAIAPDGDLVVLGSTDTVNPQRIGLARFTPEGDPDRCFGDPGCQVGGVVTHQLAGYIGYSPGDHLAIAPDGRLVVSFYGTAQGSPNGDWFVARFDPDGGFDVDFGDAGIASTGMAFDSVTFTRDVVVRPNGRIVVSGTDDNLVELVQLTTAGKPDATFDGDGRVTTFVTDVNGSRGATLAVLPDGRLALAALDLGGEAGFRVGVIRLLVNGAHDDSFGFQGRRYLGFTADQDEDGLPDFQADDEAASIVLHAGNLIVSGQTRMGDGLRRYAVLRLDTDGVFRDGFETVD